LKNLSEKVTKPFKPYRQPLKQMLQNAVKTDSTAIGPLFWVPPPTAEEIFNRADVSFAITNNIAQDSQNDIITESAREDFEEDFSSDADEIRNDDDVSFANTNSIAQDSQNDIIDQSVPKDAEKDFSSDADEIPNEDTTYVTPQSMIEELHNIQFLYQFKSNFNLTRSIKYITAIPNVCVLFIPYETGPKHLTQVYKCYCYRRYNCSAFISFSYQSNNIFLCAEEHTHTHSISESLGKRTPTAAYLTEDVVEKVREYTELGMSAGAIRIKLQLKLSAKRLYEIRRPILKSFQENQAIDLKNEVDTWNGWRTQILTNKNIFHSFYAINLHQAHQKYATFINIMDDTAKTNYFHLPLFAIITIDDNKRSKLLAFAILNNKTAAEIKLFLQFLLQVTKRPPDFMIIDRYQSQIAAIEDVFNPHCILYCRKHIASNIRDVVRNSEVLDLFWKLAKRECTEAMFLSKLYQIHNNTFSEKVQRFIDALMSEADRWLPTRVNPNSGVYVTSRVEGFFGLLKTEAQHQLLRLKDLCVLVKVLAEIESDDRILPKVPNDEFTSTGENEINEISQAESFSYSFHDLQATFESYFSVANRSSEVQRILSNTVISLKECSSSSSQVEGSIKDPPTIIYSGVPDSHPARKSHLSGPPKHKKLYHCSRCHSKFHNVKCCPRNQENQTDK
jgi:hypothetical protein